MNYLKNHQIQLTSPHQTKKIQIPDSLEILKDVVTRMFQPLPQQWALAYINSDNQEIILQAEQDFHDMIANALRVSSTISKISIIERINVPGPAEDPDYQVIEEKSEQSNDSQMTYFRQVVHMRRFFESLKPNQSPADSVISALSLSEKTLKEMVQNIINQEILRIATMTANILQIRGLQPQNQPKAQEVHADTRCEKCRVSPIVGIKYKCLVCIDYEVCEVCEAAHDHDHSLMKIKHQRQQYQPLRENKDSMPISMVQSESFEPVVQHGNEEEKSDVSQKAREINKKNEKFDLLPRILEVNREESKIEDKQVAEVEQKIDLAEKEEKPLKEQKENSEASPKKDYSDSVIQKANQVQELLREPFPNLKIDELLEFVDKAASKEDLVELMELFKLRELEKSCEKLS